MSPVDHRSLSDDELITRLVEQDDMDAFTEVVRRYKDRLLTFFLDTGDVVPHETDRREPVEPSFGP